MTLATLQHVKFWLKLLAPLNTARRQRTTVAESLCGPERVVSRGMKAWRRRRHALPHMLVTLEVFQSAMFPLKLVAS